MKKHELIARLSESAGVSKVGCSRVLDALGQAVAVALVQGQSVTLPGVGKIGLKQLQARTIRTPQGQEMDVPARAAVRFVAARALREEMARDTP